MKEHSKEGEIRKVTRAKKGNKMGAKGWMEEEEGKKLERGREGKS